MKGGLHTDELMHAVLDRESGLRTKKRVSLTFAVEIPGRDALLLLSDCAVNIQLDLATKQSIIENAVLVANAVGVGNPRWPFCPRLSRFSRASSAQWTRQP